MNALQAAERASNLLRIASQYIGIIGKRSSATAPHFGHLHKITVKSQIYYQPTDGAKNYHECSEFDAALSDVVALRFDELAKEALQRIERSQVLAWADAREEVETIMRKVEAGEASLKAEADAGSEVLA